MNPRLPYNPYRIPLPNSLARPLSWQLGPSKVRFEVPFDQDYGHFSRHLKTRFHFFSATIAAKVDQRYLPVEMSLIEFSFREGITRNYHKILEQKSIPTGLSYDCSLQQQKHRIDAQAKTEEVDSLESVFSQIVDFFGKSCRVIVLFCDDLKLQQNITIFKELQEKYGHANNYNSLSVRMYGIQQLASHFLVASGSIISPENALRLMQKSFFDSYMQKQCNYHKILQSNLCTDDDAHKVAYAFIFLMAVIHQLSIDSLPIPNLATMKPFLEKMIQRFAQ